MANFPPFAFFIFFLSLSLSLAFSLHSSPFLFTLFYAFAQKSSFFFGIASPFDEDKARLDGLSFFLSFFSFLSFLSYKLKVD